MGDVIPEHLCTIQVMFVFESVCYNNKALYIFGDKAMNSSEIRQLKVLGELMHSQKDRVNDLLESDRLRVAEPAKNFSRELMQTSERVERITSRDIDRVYENSFRRNDTDRKYQLIANVLKKSIGD
ncbi:hypothetical protein ABXV98_002053 [Salmonella enterica]|nr:hypothetical protein [Salmonella enterica]EDJ1925279.1 hypothetical protein [Salmonella enterica]EJW6203909.1 hypothetical protein [Salmonella enterica]